MHTYLYRTSTCEGLGDLQHTCGAGILTSNALTSQPASQYPVNQ